MKLNRQDVFPAAHTLTLLSIIGFHITIVLSMPALAWITALGAGAAMAGALSVVHEAAHATYFSNRRVNRIVGRVFAILILTNFSLFRRDHMRHHAHLGTELDPEPKLIVLSFHDLVKALLLNAHAISHWRESLLACIEKEQNKQIQRDSRILIIVFSGAVAATYFTPIEGIQALWLPFLISLIVDNVISLPEHAQIGEHADGSITRTIMPNPITAFLLYFVCLHREHHANPSTSAVTFTCDGGEPSQSYPAFYAAVLQRIRTDLDLSPRSSL